MSLWSGELSEVDELNAFLAISAGGSFLGRGDSTLHWILQDRKIFLFSDFLKNSFWKLWFLGLCLKEAQHRESQLRLPCCALRSTESQNGPALFFSFSFSFLSLLLFPCGWVLFCFCFVSLIKEKLFWGKEPAAALPQGGGLPMNVRLKSPAKGAVQSAGHALLTGAGPEFN